MIEINAFVEYFPIKEAFVISRETRTVQTVVRVRIDVRNLKLQTYNKPILYGEAEAVPYKRYGETPEGVVQQILSVHAHTLEELESKIASLPAGAARNALDCALWDIKAQIQNAPLWKILNIPEPKRTLTAFTISLDTPEVMATKSKEAAKTYPLLKLKLGGIDDDIRMKAVRSVAPEAMIIADANEAWTQDSLIPLMSCAHELKISLIEQPLPVDQDDILAQITRSVPICADESIHTCADLPALKNKYDAINIKLDKAGGLTEALELLNQAQKCGFQIMIGCMLATSMALKPALMLVHKANFIDLDGPLLLEQDRENGLKYDGPWII